MKASKRLGWIGLALLPLLAPALVWCQPVESKVVRDGDYWIQTVETVEPRNAATQLRIVSPGPVLVKGAPAGGLRYTLIKKVKAGGEKEARKRLQEFEVRSVTGNGVASLTVTAPRRSSVTLQVSAPKGLKQVRVETQGGDVDGSLFDGAFYAETGGGVVVLDRIGGPVTARSGGGNIRASMIRGEAALETAGGEIVIDEVLGPLRAVTAGGGIRVLRAGGTVIANTGGGLIDVRQAGGTVKAESGGGVIRLQSVSGGIRAATGSGSIDAELLAGSLFSESVLSTGLGDITVSIPSKLAVTIRAHNLSNRGGRQIISEFPGLAIRLEDGMVVAEGALNGGGPVLRLNGAGGTIFIKRRE